VRGIDTDNGSEFINETLVDYCSKQGMRFPHRERAIDERAEDEPGIPRRPSLPATRDVLSDTRDRSWFRRNIGVNLQGTM